MRQFKKNFLRKNLCFLIYEKEIIVIAVFLSITSSYQYKQKTEKSLNFNWSSYLQIFSNSNLNDFVICAIKYLLETKRIVKNRAEIKKFISFDSRSFRDAYFMSLIKKNSSNYSVSEADLNFDVYLGLIEQSLMMASNMIELKTKPENVIKLVSLIQDWKNSISIIFGSKSEYVAYAFIYNLNLNS